MKLFQSATLAVIVFVTNFSWKTFGVTLHEDLLLTAQQRRALDRFKARVIGKLPEPFMKHDIYLVRFLRARYYDVFNAEQFLLEALKWRKANKIKTIHTEDFSDIDHDYKAYLQSYDREGRPMVTANFGDWDLRKASVTGKMNRIERYIDRYLEMATRKIRQQQAAGKNVTQFQFVINMNNYNVLQHGCVPCLPFYIYLTNTYERHYPGHADRIILINTPPVFEIVLNAIRPLMSPLTRRALKVYNHDKSVWLPELLKFANRDELSPEYGGTKIYNENEP